MMFDIWGNVFVVGMGALQSGVIGMWLRIVPIQLLTTAPNLVTIRIYHDGQTVIDKSLTNDQPDVVIKVKLARYSC